MKSILSGTLLIAALPGFAATITLDLNGNGSSNGAPLSYTLTADPGPGGLSKALTYSLPFNETQGDVLLFDPNLGFPGDILRFNGNSTVVVYADNLYGLNSLAATTTPPSSTYSNTIVINETGTESNLRATYTPAVGDPGYNSSGPTYILNASTVPEPSSLAMIALAFLAAAAVWRRKPRKSSF